MKTTLAEAIDSLYLHASSTHRLIDWRPEIGVVLAAARAFSCKECGGTGKVRVAVADAVVDCRDCKQYREIANNGCL